MLRQTIAGPLMLDCFLLRSHPITKKTVAAAKKDIDTAKSVSSAVKTEGAPPGVNALTPPEEATKGMPDGPKKEIAIKIIKEMKSSVTKGEVKKEIKTGIIEHFLRPPRGGGGTEGDKMVVFKRVRCSFLFLSFSLQSFHRVADRKLLLAICSSPIQILGHD